MTMSRALISSGVSLEPLQAGFRSSDQPVVRANVTFNFAAPGTILFDAVQWMPSERRKEVMRRWLNEEEQDPS